MSRQRNFLEAIIDRKIPETCRYWSNGRCYNSADRCTYLHGYLCRNDGDCRLPDCSNIHLKQRDSFHMRSRRYSRSPSRSMSPRSRHRRNYKSPPRGKNRNYGPSRSRSRSWSRSPRRRTVRSRSRSPRRRFSRSPRRYSRSRTKSPRRRNRRSFSRGRSRSPRHQSRSPQEFQQEKSQFQSQSSRFEEVSQDFIQSSCAFEKTEEIQEISSPPEVESVSLDENVGGPTKLVVTLDDIEDGQILTPEENHPECVFLDVESGDEQICPTDEEIEVLLHSSVLKGTSSQLPNKRTRQPRREPSLTELTDRIAHDFMRPETQALLQNILKLTSDDVSSIASRDSPPSPDPLIAEKILDEVDLEEVGEEVDDYFGSVAKELHLEESVKVATNPSPPKAPDKLSTLSKCQSASRTPADYHTDWELKMALENPEKPLEKTADVPFRPPPIEKSWGKKSNSALWTPALDRRQVVKAKLKMTYQTGKSNWEVETPYIERNTKKETAPIVTASTSGEQNGKPTRVELQNPVEKQGRSIENSQKPVSSVKKELSPSGEGPSRVAGDTDTNKDMPRNVKKSLEEVQSLVEEKEMLLKEIKLLQSRRSLLQEQKSSMIRSHKGDKKSLDELLEENLFIYEKIEEEMLKRSEKIHKLDVSLVRAMKSSKSQKSGRSQSKSPDSSRKEGPSPDERSSMKARMMKPKEKDSPEHVQKYHSSKRTYECSRSPEHSVSKHDREYSRSPERGKSKHMRDYSRSPERNPLKRMHGYSRSPSNRGRDYSRSPEGGMKHIREYSRSPERSMKHTHEYSRSLERSASKRSREYSRSPERSFRNRRSPQLSRKSRCSPKNVRSARSPKRTGDQSRSPDSDCNKRSLSPESSRSKQFKSYVPLVAKIQKSHWARSHIMGTLTKFKKDLFAEVDISLKEKPKSQDVNAGAREISDYAKQPEKESSSKDLRKAKMDNSVEHKLKPQAGDKEPGSQRKPQVGDKEPGSQRKPQVGDKEPDSQSSAFFGNDTSLAPVLQSKTQYRYMDLGMHWCRLCDLVFETLPMYCNHLLSPSHLGKLKNNPKSWLAKAMREEKKPLPPDVQLISIPILGSEFFHSLPAVYCSLCDVFLRDVAEAVKHPECDTHTSNYKIYKKNHPSKVESYWKAHQGALFRHKMNSIKKDTKAEAKDDMSQQIEGRLLRELKAKRERDGKQKGENSKDGEEKTSVSIKVASREYRPSTQKPKDDNGGLGLWPKEKSQAKQAKEGKSHPKEVHEKVAKESKQQGKENDVQVARVMAQSAEVEEKVVEKLVESRETDDDDKLQSMLQDKYTKESVSVTSVKFPLVGKMPSFRKKVNGKKTGIGSSKDPVSLDSKLPDSNDLSESVESLPVDGGNSHEIKSIGGQDNESIVMPPDSIEESKPDENLTRNNPENVNLTQEGIGLKGTVTKGSSASLSMSTTKEPEELMHEMHEAMMSDMELEEEGSTSDEETGKENNVDPDASCFERTDRGYSKMFGPDLEKPNSLSDENESDIASATVEALQLLNIPLPGFEPSKKTQAPILVPEGKEDIGIHQVMEIPLPPPSATAKTLELDSLTPFSHCSQIEAGMISYSCEVQNKISLPSPMSTSKTLLLEALNPFSHSMQMDAGMIPYGSDVPNMFSLESSCVDAPMPYSNHESLSSFPCPSRECTPPPPGTETAPELQGELPYVDEHENSTPPPPGTEPSLTVKSPVQDCSKRRNDSNNVKEKSESAVEPSKSLDNSEKKGKSVPAAQIKLLRKSAEIEQRLSEMFADECSEKENIAEFGAHILEVVPVVKDLSSSSQIKGEAETSIEKFSEREDLNMPESSEDAKTKEHTQASSPANKSNKCSSNIKSPLEIELTETSDSSKSHGESSEEMDPKTDDIDELERPKRGTKSLCVNLHRVVVSMRGETDSTSQESLDDIESIRILDQVISSEDDASKDNVSISPLSEDDKNPDSTGLATKKVAFDEESEENKNDKVISSDSSQETLESVEEETVEEEASGASPRPRRTTRSTRSDKAKVEASTKQPRGKSSSSEHPKVGDSDLCPNLPVKSMMPLETLMDSTEDELSLDSLPDLRKLAEVSVPPPEEEHVTCAVRRSVRNAVNDKDESNASNETAKGKSKASTRKEVLPSRRSSRTAKSSSLVETPDTSKQKVPETLEEKYEAEANQGVGPDSQEEDGMQKLPTETSKKKKESPITPKRSTRRATVMDSKAKQQKCLPASGESS